MKEHIYYNSIKCINSQKTKHKGQKQLLGVWQSKFRSLHPLREDNNRGRHFLGEKGVPKFWHHSQCPHLFQNCLQASVHRFYSLHKIFQKYNTALSVIKSVNMVQRITALSLNI